MKILSLDTSTKNFSLAVSSGEKILASRCIQSKKVLSDEIIPAIKQILQKAKLRVSDLDGFAVGLGPGSFTGLRVGIATVKGLAAASGKPALGVSSLDLLAMQAAQENPSPKFKICTLVDARRNLVYFSLFEKNGQKLTRKSKYLLTNLESALDNVPESNVVFVGDAASLYKKRIEDRVNPRFEEKIIYPEAKYLPALVSEKFEKNKSDFLAKLVPIYLYAADCQVDPKMKKGNA